MKLFYTRTERQLLRIDDPATVALDKRLWDVAWRIYCRIDDKLRANKSVSRKEIRLISHLSYLLQI